MIARTSSRAARALLVLLLISSASSLSTRAQTARSSDLPSPEQFFGFRMGEDRKLANWDKLVEVPPGAREDGEEPAARRSRQVERGQALHRALHLVAGEPREAGSTAAAERAARGSPRPVRARGAEDRRRSARGRHPELCAALERGGRVADGGRVRLRQRLAHGRRVAADARQRDQHRRAVDQPRRDADDRRLVHEVRRHAVRSRGAPVAVPEVLRARQQPRRIRAEPAGVAEPREAHVPGLDAAGVRRPSPDGQRQRAPVHPAVRGADPSRRRSAGLA